MKILFALAILLALSGCARSPVVPEQEENVPDAPQSLTIQTEKYTYTGTLAHENGTATWQIAWELTEPQDIAGLTFVCTDTSCTLVVEDVVIPLDAGTAEVVREMLVQEK